MNKRYNELAKANIHDGENKINVVISEMLVQKSNADKYEKSGFTIAQQLEVNNGKKKINVFLKSAMHVGDINGLYELRDALNVAISKLEEENNDDNWD